MYELFMMCHVGLGDSQISALESKITSRLRTPIYENHDAATVLNSYHGYGCTMHFILSTN